MVCVTKRSAHNQTRAWVSLDGAALLTNDLFIGNNSIARVTLTDAANDVDLYCCDESAFRSIFIPRVGIQAYSNSVPRRTYLIKTSKFFCFVILFPPCRRCKPMTICERNGKRIIVVSYFEVMLYCNLVMQCNHIITTSDLRLHCVREIRYMFIVLVLRPDYFLSISFNYFYFFILFIFYFLFRVYLNMLMWRVDALIEPRLQKLIVIHPTRH